MAQVNSVTVTVRPKESEVYWSLVLVNAGGFGITLGLFVLMVLVFIFGALFPRPNALWYHILERFKPVFWLFLLPVVIVLGSSGTTTIRFFRELSNLLAVTYHFSETGVEVKPSGGNPHLDWDSLPRAVETRRAFQLFDKYGHRRVIPKRCLAGLPEIRLLREILRCCVSSFKPRQD